MLAACSEDVTAIGADAGTGVDATEVDATEVDAADGDAGEVLFSEAGASDAEPVRRGEVFEDPPASATNVLVIAAEPRSASQESAFDGRLEVGADGTQRLVFDAEVPLRPHPEGVLRHEHRIGALFGRDCGSISGTFAFDQIEVPPGSITVALGGGGDLILGYSEAADTTAVARGWLRNEAPTHVLGRRARFFESKCASGSASSRPPACTWLSTAPVILCGWIRVAALRSYLCGRSMRAIGAYRRRTPRCRGR